MQEEKQDEIFSKTTRDLWQRSDPDTVHRIVTYWLECKAIDFDVSDCKWLQWQSQWPSKWNQTDNFGSQILHDTQTAKLHLLQLQKIVNTQTISMENQPLKELFLLLPGQRTTIEIQLPVIQMEHFLWPNQPLVINKEEEKEFSQVQLRRRVTVWALHLQDETDCLRVLSLRAQMWHATIYPRDTFIVYGSWVINNKVRLLFTEEVLLADQQIPNVICSFEPTILDSSRLDFPESYVWFDTKKNCYPIQSIPKPFTTYTGTLFLSKEEESTTTGNVALFMKYPSSSSWKHPGFLLQLDSSTTTTTTTNTIQTHSCLIPMNKKEVWELLITEEVQIVTVPHRFLNQ